MNETPYKTHKVRAQHRDRKDGRAFSFDNVKYATKHWALLLT